MRRPEGPAAVSLGKDRNIAMIFISAGIKNIRQDWSDRAVQTEYVLK